MIVLSDALVLTPASPEGGPNHPVIGWQNYVNVSNLSADEEDTDHPVSNLANPATFLRWQGLTTDAQSILASVQTTESVDYVAFAGHNFGSSQISVTINGSANGVDFSELVQETLLGDDSPAIFRFEPQALNTLEVALGSGNDIPRCAVMYVGKLLVLQRRIYVGHVPIKYGRMVNVASGRSETGQFLGRIVTGRGNRTAVDLQNITPDWFRSKMVPFLRAAEEGPFFFAWRPGDYPDEVGYAWLTADPEPTNQRPNGMMQVFLEMEGVI